MQGEQADVVPLPAALKDPYGHALGSAVPPRQYAPSGHVWHAMPTPARYVPGAQTGFEGVADGVAPVDRLAVTVGESVRAGVRDTLRDALGDTLTESSTLADGVTERPDVGDTLADGDTLGVTERPDVGDTLPVIESDCATAQ